MTEDTPRARRVDDMSSAHDWRPPTETDWRRLRTLLRDVHLQHDAEHWEQAEKDMGAIGR